MSSTKTKLSAAAALPDELIIEILSRLPLKSLLRFKSVSKSWSALIRDPRFASDHLRRSVISSKGGSVVPLSSYLVVVSLRNTLRAYVFSSGEEFEALYTAKLPPHVSEFYIIGCCNGILCCTLDERRLFLWNPMTREKRALPDSLFGPDDVFDGLTCNAGFGYVSKTDDYKVVRFAYSSAERHNRYYHFAEVFSLNDGLWRQLHPPRGLFIVNGLLQVGGRLNAAELNGFLYWSAYLKDNDGTKSMKILSFDLDSEEFGLMDPPKASTPYSTIGVYQNSLCFMSFKNITMTSRTCGLWVMTGSTCNNNSKGGGWIEAIPDFRCDGGIFSPMGYGIHGEIFFRLEKRRTGRQEMMVVYDPSSIAFRSISFEFDRRAEVRSCVHLYTKSLVRLASK